MENRLTSFHKEHIFRRTNIIDFVGIKRTEERMLRNFPQNFKSFKKTTIEISDGEECQCRKFKKLPKGKRFRNISCKAGHDIYLVAKFQISYHRSTYEEPGECMTSWEFENPSLHGNESVLRRRLEV